MPNLHVSLTYHSVQVEIFQVMELIAVHPLATAPREQEWLSHRSTNRDQVYQCPQPLSQSQSPAKPINVINMN